MNKILHVFYLIDIFVNFTEGKITFLQFSLYYGLYENLIFKVNEYKNIYSQNNRSS